MDVDVSDSDEEIDLQDINRLTSVLEDPALDTASQCSASKADSIVSTSSSNAPDTSKIDRAIALNRMTDEKLQKLEKTLQQRLHECRARLAEIQITTCDKVDNTESCNYISCRRPYFKDKQNFVPPDNDDTILMNRTQMFDFSDITTVPGWTIKDKSEFLKLMEVMSIDIHKQRIYSRISQLERNLKVKSSARLNREIAKLKDELTKIGNKTIEELALPINEEYDWECIAIKLNLRHSAHEYRSLWKLFLHPSINKDAWTKQEHTNLQKIANEYKTQDWDKIADKLGTRRTGYQCFVYFRANMSNTYTGQKWTKEEEEYLRRLIEFYKEDDHIPWGRVASSMENRTKMQLYNKYMRLIELRKGRFLVEEDAVILTCVENFGKNYKRMTKYLPGRSIMQIRNRSKILEKRRISSVWSVADDEKLVQMMPNFDMQKFSSLAKYFPGKDRASIRSRCLTLTKWMKFNPNLGLEFAPRRGARLLGRGNACENLGKAVEKLKNKIETDVEVKKKKVRKITKESPHSVLDDAIIAELITEQILDKDNDDGESDHQSVDDDFIPTIATTTNSHVSDMKHLLLLLKSQLNHMTFQSSIFNKKYPGLSESTEKTLLKVKSYSRKETVQTFDKPDEPNVWGDNALKNTSLVLPPNYSTITGCRQLMSYLTKPQSENKMNISLLCRKNTLIKEQFNKLMDRMNLLFIWPLILSNEFPKRFEEALTDKTESP